MAVALSAHTLGMNLSAYSATVCWCSELGQNAPTRQVPSMGQQKCDLLLLLLLLFSLQVIMIVMSIVIWEQHGAKLRNWTTRH